MPRRSVAPKLWLDRKRGTWTIFDGSKRIRTGYLEDEVKAAQVALEQYRNGVEMDVWQMPARPNPNRGPRGVYVIGFGPYVKIGITTNLTRRLADLQTPEPVILYAFFEGWLHEELELHKRFAEWRLNGEWFRREGGLDDWIKGGCK